METEHSLKQLLVSLVLSAPISLVEGMSLPQDPAFSSDLEAIKQAILNMVGGKSSELVYNNKYDSILYGTTAMAILDEYPAVDLNSVMRKYVEYIRHEFTAGSPQLGDAHLQLIAIGFLQTFIQLNFTGPSVSYSQNIFFPQVDGNLVQLEALKLLGLEGQVPYDLMVDPIFFLVASLIFESLHNTPAEDSLVGPSSAVNGETISKSLTTFIETNKGNPIVASSLWWRSRLLQTHLSLFSEPPGIIPTISTLLLTPEVVTTLGAGCDSVLQQTLQIEYFIEAARFGIHGQAEHLSIPLLHQAQKASKLDLVLTGARAKRTKYQKFHTSNLIVLAKSQQPEFFGREANDTNPENHDLNSDVLLERPVFESLENVEMPDQPNSKRIKFDPSTNEEEDGSQKLLPIALRQEDIPVNLKDIDPNNQPPLCELDAIQLLLRLATLRQTSPSGNVLVEEELLALVSRILYVDAKNVNWSIFGRALWERSILETNKAKTIERGILQMTSIIEEIGIKIKTRMIPQVEDNSDPSTVIASRLRFIHQLPLLPQWAMDIKLADKYMSIGVTRSALEIYERLQLPCEAALCNAAVDNEKEAERILLDRISKHPEDARAISILGDVRQDPSLWEKAWEVGKYHKAKASLSQYYYSPPPDSGVTKSVELAVKHMNDALQINPLSYENWFFYGCCGLESQQFELASEAFTRCVALDDSSSYAWSNLATSLLRLDKTRPAFNALKKALRAANENKRSWRIYENYLIVAMKLHEWNDVLIATKELINIKGENEGERSIDIPIIERLVEILVSTEFPKDEEGARLTYYQTSCIDLVCNMLPKVITTSSRCWRIVARVELWRKKPWDSLECHEKAYRAVSNNPELDTNEQIWNESVDACSDLCAAYESLGEMPGKYGAGEVVCKDWKYKARSTVRSLMSKGRDMWQDSEGWNTLQDLKSEYTN